MRYEVFGVGVWCLVSESNHDGSGIYIFGCLKERFKKYSQNKL